MTAMTTSRRTIVEALQYREARQSIVSSYVLTDTSPPSRINAVWRQKVIHWYFTVVAALRRQHAASSAASPGSSSSDVNPFDRTMVHVSASLLDGYLASLSGERAMRYKRRAAYQLLATTCLLLGMRLARHESIKEDLVSTDGGGGLKRAKTHRTNMNDAINEASTAAATRVAIPTAATILRISAAPMSITERHVLAMVNELTGSRSFPRSGGVVTALDYVRALSSSFPSSGYTDEEEDLPVSLGPDGAEEARRLADLALVDSTYPPLRPAVLACAVISLVLSKSSSSSDVVRRCVHRSVLGRLADDPELVRAACKAESHLRVLRSEPPSRDARRAIIAPPTSHLIPLEDD
ncbi:hypothetical protein ACHAXA_005426 [Cyclostephanos tholiformis]|uniref:Cyclin N-terminal domain-containing protein n=1 Tax=Cyclostephanos tholiformis TaxID=382380 RepID=A0ABD3R910_9STRA